MLHYSSYWLQCRKDRSVLNHKKRFSRILFSNKNISFKFMRIADYYFPKTLSNQDNNIRNQNCYRYLLSKH